MQNIPLYGIHPEHPEHPEHLEQTNGYRPSDCLCIYLAQNLNGGACRAAPVVDQSSLGRVSELPIHFRDVAVAERPGKVALGGSDIAARVDRHARRERVRAADQICDALGELGSVALAGSPAPRIWRRSGLGFLARSPSPGNQPARVRRSWGFLRLACPADHDQRQCGAELDEQRRDEHEPWEQILSAD